MPVDALLSVCPPPETPAYPPQPQHWAALEAQVGGPLPADYRMLVARYGSGVFGAYDDAGAFFDLLFVLSPAHPPGPHDLNAVPLMTELTKSLADIQGRWPKQVPFPVWPGPGGLLYVGGTTTQHGLYWQTQGPADAWTCVVGDFGCDHWFFWEQDLSSLLAAVVSGHVPGWITEGAPRFPLVFRDIGSLENARLV